MASWIDGLSIAAIIFVGLALLTMIHRPAHAEDDIIERIAVAVRGSDLADAPHAAGLLRRIDAAALRACGFQEGMLAPVRAAIAHSSCHQESVARAVAALHSPLLDQVASGQVPVPERLAEQEVGQ